MKKLNLTKKKLSKKELKDINGGQIGPCWEGFCKTGEFEEWQLGPGDRNGYCC